MSAPRQTDRDYFEELGMVLRRRDPEALREFLMGKARQFGDEAQICQIAGQSAPEMEALLHRMITVRPDLRELHQESRSWLARNQSHHPASKAHRPDR